MQREYTRVYPGSSKESPTSSRGRECCISLHLSACVGVTSCERGNLSQVSRKEKNRVLLEMLISEVEKISIFVVLFAEPSALSFIESSEGQGISKTLRRCLRGEGSAGTAEVVVATCPSNGWPSPGCHGDVDDGTVKGPGSYGERAIPCGRRTGVIPLLTGGARGLVGT
jgi:hypothetical protein